MRTVVLRLAQTFGGGVRRDDERVFAEFARCAEEGRDIVLLSDGSKRNCYLSVNDAASAILAVLANDEASGATTSPTPIPIAVFSKWRAWFFANLVRRMLGFPSGSMETAPRRFAKGAISSSIFRVCAVLAGSRAKDFAMRTANF